MLLLFMFHGTHVVFAFFLGLFAYRLDTYSYLRKPSRWWSRFLSMNISSGRGPWMKRFWFIDGRSAQGNPSGLDPVEIWVEEHELRVLVLYVKICLFMLLGFGRPSMTLIYGLALVVLFIYLYGTVIRSFVTT